MSLFQNSVLNKYLKGLETEKVKEAYEKFTRHFHNPEIQENIRNSKEEQYQGEFLIDLFVNVLGYIKNPTPEFNLTTELKNIKSSKKTDGAILSGEKALAVIELKGTNTTDLSKVETQAFGYKNNQPGCNYVITSNFEKLRFYIDNAVDFEEFTLFQLTKERFDILWLCLSSDYLLKNIPKKIKDESLTQEENITKKLYNDYSEFRNEIFDSIQKENPEYNKLTLFKKTQKLLDRFLFIFFAEDRLLLPPNSIRSIVNQWADLRDKYDEYFPLYDRFKKYFGYMNTGHKGQQHDIFAYNGGLFATDEILDNIKINDNILFKHTVNLSNYDFESDVSVNILGHIFEHSLNDIEAIQSEIEGISTDQSKTKRKKDGVFYTPKYITKYIVENTIGKLCGEKKIELDIQEAEYEKERKGRQKATLKKLTQKLDDYRKWLLQITICDPACGSGAFLNQSLEFLIAEHRFIDELQAKLFGASMILSEVENSILENNLYGVDINEESVEIAKLSLWLRTAQKGRKLTTLNNNIKCGNSLIDDPNIAGEKAFNWKNEFPNVFKKGGFDVVIGNPPYVVKIGKEESNYFRNEYETIQGKKYDLFRFFIEKGLKILGIKSYLGFITPDVFLHLKQASILRKYILEKYNITQVILAPLNTFDASVESVIFIVEKPKTRNSIVSFKDISTNEVIQLMNQDDLMVNDFNIEYTSGQTSDIIGKITNTGKKIGDFMIWKKGLGVYSRQHLSNKFSLEEVDDIMANRPWTKDFKADNTFGKEIIGKDVFRYNLEWNGIKWLSYGPWLAFQRPLEFFKGPRLLVREITTTGRYNINCAIVVDEYFNNQSMFNGILREDNNYTDLKYILAFLNSKLYSYYISSNSPKINRKLFPTILMENIENFSIPINVTLETKHKIIILVDVIISKIKNKSMLNSNFIQLLQSKFSIAKTSQKLQNWHDLEFGEFLKELKKQKVQLSLSEEAEWMQYFNEQKVKAQALRTEINKTDNEIDQLVYELYGLSENEIKIVEEASA